MKLALFGATGTVGTALLAQALDAGHQVRVLARTPAKIGCSDAALTVLAGDAKDPAAVAATLVGCDGVLSALGGSADSDSIRFNSVVNADIAALALSSLTDPAAIGTAPMIANGGRHALGAVGYWLLGRRPDLRLAATDS